MLRFAKGLATNCQRVNELLERKMDRIKFLSELREYLDSCGQPLTRIPVCWAIKGLGRVDALAAPVLQAVLRG